MKNSKITYSLIALVVFVTTCFVMSGCKKKSDNYVAQETNKEERQHIKNGNELFEKKEFADAEVEYRKALQANPKSAAACYNLALSLAKQINNSDSVNQKELFNEADSIFKMATTMTKDSLLIAMANHNIGNLKFQQEDFKGAIEAYKKALRANPADNDTRYNLRMAQLKKQEQEEKEKQEQNKKQQQDKKDQDKQNQEQQKQEQQKQEQQKQEQQKQEQQKQEQQNQDKQNQEEQNQKENSDKSQPKPDNNDDRSSQQVLKAMQDKEKETQQKVKEMQRQQQRGSRHKW